MRVLAVISVCLSVVMPSAHAAAQASNDGFESYPVGTQLHHLNGWAGWDDSISHGALTTNVRARTGTESVDITGNPGGTDLVQTYTPTTGRWRYTAWQYVPSTATGSEFYFILMSMYYPNGSKAWSAQIYFNLGSNVLYDNLGGISSNVLTIVRDQWVPIIVDIDLDHNTQTASYNNQTLYTGPWIRMGGPMGFMAVDLYGDNIDHVYYDDISLARLNTGVQVARWKEVGPDGE